MEKEEIIRDEILAAAKRVFQKWGLNKSTMEDIAHEAGKGKSTLYYYFKSKDEIFETLAMDEMSSIIIKAKTAIKDLVSTRDKLRIYLVTMLNEIKNTISLYPMVTGELKGNKELIERIRNLLDSNEVSIMTEILTVGISTGEFNFLKESEISKAVKVIVGILHGLIFYLVFDNDDTESIDLATRLIVEGI
jgi:AcrR family transcriptional regulator